MADNELASQGVSYCVPDLQRKEKEMKYLDIKDTL